MRGQIQAPTALFPGEKKSLVPDEYGARWVPEFACTFWRRMNFTACMDVSFIIFLSYASGSILYHRIYGCMFCILLFNFVNYVFLLLSYVFFCYVYVFLLLCMFRSLYSVSLCCSVYCLCVNVYCTTATGCQPNCS